MVLQKMAIKFVHNRHKSVWKLCYFILLEILSAKLNSLDEIIIKMKNYIEAYFYYQLQHLYVIIFGWEKVVTSKSWWSTRAIFEG